MLNLQKQFFVQNLHITKTYQKKVLQKNLIYQNINYLQDWLKIKKCIEIFFIYIF